MTHTFLLGALDAFPFFFTSEVWAPFRPTRQMYCPKPRLPVAPTNVGPPSTQRSKSTRRDPSQLHGIRKRTPFGSHRYRVIHFFFAKLSSYRFVLSCCLQILVSSDALLPFISRVASDISSKSFRRFTDLVALPCDILHTWVDTKPTRASSRFHFLIVVLTVATEAKPCVCGTRFRLFLLSSEGVYRFLNDTSVSGF